MDFTLEALVAWHLIQTAQRDVKEAELHAVIKSIDGKLTLVRAQLVDATTKYESRLAEVTTKLEQQIQRRIDEGIANKVDKATTAAQHAIDKATIVAQHAIDKASIAADHEKYKAQNEKDKAATAAQYETDKAAAAAQRLDDIATRKMERSMDAEKYTKYKADADAKDARLSEIVNDDKREVMQSINVLRAFAISQVILTHAFK